MYRHLYFAYKTTINGKNNEFFVIFVTSFTIDVDKNDKTSTTYRKKTFGLPFIDSDYFRIQLALYYIVDHLCVFMSCVSHAFESVHCCLVVISWERADLLALLVMLIAFLLLSNVVSWVSCGT